MSPIQITTSTSQEYRHRLASITARAVLLDPFNHVLQRDNILTPTDVTYENIYTSTINRINAKIALGSVIVEASDFAAVACWEPPGKVRPDLTPAELEDLAKERPLFAGFVRDYEEAKRRVLGGALCWQLSLMARDPERVAKGAVRALMEPYLERARTEGCPVWCIAGNSHAKAVYEHFGFRVVRDIEVGAVVVWAMVANWPPVES